MITVALTVAPFAGDVIATAGGAASLTTLTVTLIDVEVFPAVSRATADNTCEPFVVVVVSQSTLYGATVSSAPSAAPSRRNWTPATAALSVAVALTASEAQTWVPATRDV